MKLVSLNIEIDRNYSAIESFLESEKPDFFCVQEINKQAFDKWKKSLL